MGQYYDTIMIPNEGSFTHCFNACWQAQLDQFPSPYSDAVQLRIGNQLRPKLTCWGAAFNTGGANELDLEKISTIASYIEMLHKASIIIDDLIDGDNARHAAKTFHIEFGNEKAIIFALALLGKGMAGINHIFQNTGSHYQSMKLYSGTIYRMATGCLEELELDQFSRYDISKIQRIISLETITLIKNSFLLGYWLNFDGNAAAEEAIVKIGENCGYIFQILNDLEPFSAAEKNMAYKGSRNIDIDRDRKNIVVAYIHGAATTKEKQTLSTLSGESLQTMIMELYDKYSVYDAICREARELELQTENLIEVVRQTITHAESLDDFKLFVHEMIEICFSKL